MLSQQFEMADNLQACSSVVPVVRTAGEYDNSHAETEIQFIRKIFKFSIAL